MGLNQGDIMAIESILDSTSFSTLDDAGQDAVRELYQSYNRGIPLYIEPLPLFRKRVSIAASLDYWGYKLGKTNPAMFKFLNDSQRDALKNELLGTFGLLSAQYQLDESEHRRQGLRALSEQIKTCAKLIELLKYTAPFGDKEPPEYTFIRPLNDSEKHAKYLGLTIVAPFIAGKIAELSVGDKEWKGAGKTGVIKEWMGEVNGRRLYWVWGGGLLRTVISMLPDDFYNKPQAQKAVSAPAPITGYMSWILYYTRFGINLSLLLKHTIAGPWMSQKEREIPAWERFKTQWQERKFALLNDAIWGLANMVCFFWLTGVGMAGYLGDMATLGLLLMDTCLTAWHFYEESTAHNVDIKRYERDIAALNERLNDKKLNNKDRERLEIERDNLIRAQEHCEFEWKYKSYKFATDVIYAATLMFAFSLMVCFSFPPTALIFGVTGAALCFALTLGYAIANGLIDIAKERQSGLSSKKECEALLSKFKQLNAETDKDENGFVKKQLYLDMQSLMADSDYQKRLVQYKKLQLVRAVLIDVLLPPLIFVSFMFMPLGIGLGVLAAGFALAILSRIILGRFEPKAAALPEMNEAGYKKFAGLSEPTLKDLTSDVTLKNLEAGSFFHKVTPVDGLLPDDIPPYRPLA